MLKSVYCPSAFLFDLSIDEIPYSKLPADSMCALSDCRLSL